jgi:hypothetical protein
VSGAGRLQQILDAELHLETTRWALGHHLRPPEHRAMRGRPATVRCARSAVADRPGTARKRAGAALTERGGGVRGGVRR